MRMVLEEKRGVFEAKGMASCGGGWEMCMHLLLPHALGLGKMRFGF